MNIEQRLNTACTQAIKNLFAQDVLVELQKTRKDFEGDYTLVVFAYLRFSKKSAEQTAEMIGDELLQKHQKLIAGYNVVKGFLNISLQQEVWMEFFKQKQLEENYGISPQSGKKTMLEYSSPNTNKPLHLGHLRNNFLGHSLSRILKACGEEVIKVQIINDRGIHICKSMLAWRDFGNGETPESAGLKGDHLVGKYYVEFDKRYKAQIADLVQKGMTEETGKKEAPIMQEAQDMLRKWEANDPVITALWNKMNSWVYEGFKETYEKMGVDFDKLYYESETYLIGKEKVLEHLNESNLYKKEDGSIWIDLSDEGLDNKLLLRSDGTSVYMTQDIGTAVQRHEEFHCDEYIYVVGNEQDYHFKALALILQKMGYDWARGIEHLSYGMVDLPSGKMKSREGTVVDADDLMKEMAKTAKEISSELGKLEDLEEQEKEKLFHIIGMGALKYFILKVDPKKRMLFDPRESVDFSGNTGPFIQYTYARIQSILKKSGITAAAYESAELELNPKELTLLKRCYDFPAVIQEAGKMRSPALIANFCYELVKEYNNFYQTVPILKEENKDLMVFRVKLSEFTGRLIKRSMHLLGIQVPDQM